MSAFSKKFIFLLILSLLIRLIIMFWAINFRENTDILRYKDWGRIAYLYGFADTYKTNHLTFGTLANNQPPGSLYIISASYNAQFQTAKIIAKITRTKPGSNPWINGPLLDIFLRIPSILADIVIGIILYILIKSEKPEANALIASSLFLFNPVVLYDSASWGQMDSLNNLPFLLAVFFLIRRKYFRSVLSYLISLFIKISLLPLLPIFLIFLILFKSERKTLLISVSLVSLLIIFALTLPVSSNPASWIWNYLTKNSQGEMANITNFAFNFWWLVIKPEIRMGKPDNLFNFSTISLNGIPSKNYLAGGLNLDLWGYILFAILFIPIAIEIILQKGKQIKHSTVFLSLSLLALTSFLFLPFMHERYMYPLFPLLAAYAGLSKKNTLTYVILSFCNFINLYIVWHPMPLFFLPYVLISNRLFQWSISAIIFFTGIIFYINVLRKNILYEKTSE